MHWGERFGAGSGRPIRGRRVAVAVGLAFLATGTGCTSGGPPKAGPSPTPQLRMTSFTATPVSGGQVDLSWGAAGKNVYGYDLYRNGKLVDLFTLTAYHDYGVVPGHTYEYKVDVQDSKGHFSDQATATVTTPAPPPLAQARLAGRYGARYTYRSENYVNRKVGDTFRARWILHPKCPTGPCSAVLRTGAPGGHPATLTKHGTGYSGKGSDDLGRCNSQKIRRTLTISVRVTHARFVKGVWRATALTGTQSEYSPPGFGCIAGEAKASMVARYLG